jgi:type 1 glutamine amidotransferase
MKLLVAIVTLFASSAMAADRVIVVTATAGFRHDSIPVAEQVIADIASRTRWFDPVFVHTEEEMADALSVEALRSARLVMFVNTTGELPTLDNLLSWIRDGGSFLGVHSAADTWHSSPDYIAMLGGEFLTHSAESSVGVVVDQMHPASAGLESPHFVFEEIYSFTNFAGGEMLLHVDDGRPLAWVKGYGAGRVFYTALGHREDVWTSAWFQQHITGAIAWSLGRDLTMRRRAVRR